MASKKTAVEMGQRMLFFHDVLPTKIRKWPLIEKKAAAVLIGTLKLVGAAAAAEKLNILIFQARREKGPHHTSHHKIRSEISNTQARKNEG